MYYNMKRNGKHYGELYILLFKRQNHKFLNIINMFELAYILSHYREFIEVMNEMGQEL